MERTLTQAATIAQPAEVLRAEDFDHLVRNHQRRIYRVLLALTRDADAAETLTQECFLRAYQKRASFRGEASVGTWLVRIAVNLAADHRKNRRRAFWSRAFSPNEPEREIPRLRSGQAHWPDAEVADAASSPEQALAARQELKQVWEAANRLSSQQRTIFLLRFVEELTLEEIARAMELEVGTVKTHLHRAVGAIRQSLKETSGR